MTDAVQRTGSWKRRLRRWLIGEDLRATLRRVLVTSVVLIIVLNYVLLPVQVKGDSMAPAFRDGSWHIANLLKYKFREPRRGEVVVIRSGTGRVLYLKRILALPGESVRFFNGQLIVNGREQKEPYVVYKGKWTLPEYKLKADEYFVAGDNRSTGPESHMMGVVRRKSIAGGILR